MSAPFSSLSLFFQSRILDLTGQVRAGQHLSGASPAVRALPRGCLEQDLSLGAGGGTKHLFCSGWAAWLVAFPWQNNAENTVLSVLWSTWDCFAGSTEVFMGCKHTTPLHVHSRIQNLLGSYRKNSQNSLGKCCIGPGC